jgi:hypothetical protein
MGKAAREGRKRRELLQAHRRDMAVLGGQQQALQEKIAASWDEQCAALRDGDAGDQAKRLHSAGWRIIEENMDGIGHWRHRGRRAGLIHSLARESDGQVWAHVSVSHADNTMPGWYEVRDAGWALYPARFGIIVVAPQDRHVNIANVAHIWYCLTSDAVPPDFSHGLGSI